MIVVRSGPSASGKDAVADRILSEHADRISPAITATTRPPRPGELDGVHYHFMTPEAFAELERSDQLLESATVYGFRYGVPRQSVRDALERAPIALVKTDVQGARSIKALIPQALSLFITAPDFATLERRMRSRGGMDSATMDRRLQEAQAEMARQGRVRIHHHQRRRPPGRRRNPNLANHPPGIPKPYPPNHRSLAPPARAPHVIPSAARNPKPQSSHHPPCHPPHPIRIPRTPPVSPRSTRIPRASSYPPRRRGAHIPHPSRPPPPVTPALPTCHSERSRGIQNLNCPNQPPARVAALAWGRWRHLDDSPSLRPYATA